MKTLTTLAILLSLSPLAAGCMAPTGDESTQSRDDALMNNGNSDPDRSEDDLKKDGWDCGPIDGTDVCTKDGTNTIYYCRPNGMCTAGLVVQPPPHKGIILPRPITGPIKASL